MDVLGYVKKLWQNKRVLVLLGAIVVLAVFIETRGLGTISPGFEGAKCNFYGLYFPSGSWPGLIGTNTLHRYQDAESALLSIAKAPYVTWTSLATPNDAGINSLKDISSVFTGYRKPDLKIHVESNLQLEDITRQGDPLGWNASNPMDARRVEYWSKKAVKVSEVNDTANSRTVITYRYNYTKESFILSPVEFWVGFYLVPAQEKAGTGSTWREGEYQNIVAWFMLDFNVWDNAYRDPWLDDPKVNVFTSEYNGSVLNEQRLYDYRGGFPIAGWVQGWEKAGWTSTNSEQDAPVWATREAGGGSASKVDKTEKTYTADQLAELKSELMAKVKFSPDLVGQFISLYNVPDVKFEYKSDLSQSGFESNQGITADVKTPDSTMHKTMYFPINIDNFGTLVKGDWWNGWYVYYPSAYFRIRMIYGVYGTFTYLWTEQVTQAWKIVNPVTGQPEYPGGLDFPDETERVGTTVIHTQGVSSWFEGITDFFTNPMTLMWTFFIIIVIVVLFVTVFNPGLWAAIVSGRKRTQAPARSASSGSKKKRWGQGHK